jgi:hypothetical protein
MFRRYLGRHTSGAHRAPSIRGARTSRKPRLFSHAVRRPLGSLAAVVAVAGASAGGFASAAKPHTSTTSFTAGPAATAQAAELADNNSDTNADLVQGRRAGVQRAIASAQQVKAEAAALIRTRAAAAAAQTKARAAAAAAKAAARAAAAELSRARTVEAERSSRSMARESLLARSQSDPKSAARALAADRGWSGEQFDCLSSLWTKESGWRWDADNPTSDAYGIPQALPGSKMASSGSDWETNPVTQIKWGLQYISSTYGTPCSAWAKSQSSNWY